MSRTRMSKAAADLLADPDVERSVRRWRRWRHLPFDAQVERAHREILRELVNCIPWAPRSVAREVAKRYREAWQR